MPEATTDVYVALGAEDVRAGRLWTRSRTGRETASFAYAEEYLGRRGAYELDPALPLVTGQQQVPEGRAMFAAFADTAPDRWGRELLAAAARAEGRGAPTEAGYLLGVRDELRQGALRFRDPDSGVFHASPASGVPALVELPALLSAAEQFERNEATDADFARLLAGGSSPGGARPKAHVVRPDGRLTIAKFPSPEHDDWDVMRWEAVTLSLARASGIEVADWSLETIADRPVLLLDRFDRTATSRIGYVSVMTMLELTDGDRGDYVDIADVLERESPRASDDLRELWRRMVFGVLITNTDDHLRNHGLLRRVSAGWQLSPAFDLNPDPRAGASPQHRTRVDGEADPDIARLLGVAEVFRLDPEEARRTVTEVLDAVAGWRSAAHRVGLDAAAVEQMAPAFEHARADEARAMA